jgi:hypothetical protein
MIRRTAMLSIDRAMVNRRDERGVVRVAISGFLFRRAHD